jgi:hypothetical protein
MGICGTGHCKKKNIKKKFLDSGNMWDKYFFNYNSKKTPYA